MDKVELVARVLCRHEVSRRYVADKVDDAVISSAVEKEWRLWADQARIAIDQVERAERVRRSAPSA